MPQRAGGIRVDVTYRYGVKNEDKKRTSEIMILPSSLD